MPTSQNMESDRPAPTWNPIRKQSRILNVTDKGKVTVFRSGSREALSLSGVALQVAQLRLQLHAPAGPQLPFLRFGLQSEP